LKAYRSHNYHRVTFPRPDHSCGILRKGAAPRERITAQNIGYKEKKCSWAHTSEDSMSSSLVDSATALRLAAFLPPAETNTWGKESAAIYVRLSNERTCLLFGRSGCSTPATARRGLVRFFLHFRLLGRLRERARRCCKGAVWRAHASIAIWPGGATSRPRALLRIYVSTQLRVTARHCGERSQW
jgi:hypothetical protein